MRRRNGRLVLSLLLSVALLSMNISFVYAREQSLSDGSSSLGKTVSDADTSSTASSQANGAEQTGKTDEGTDGKSNSEAEAGGGNSEIGENKDDKDAGTEEGSTENKEDGAVTDGEDAGTSENPGDKTEGETGDSADKPEGTEGTDGAEEPDSAEGTDGAEEPDSAEGTDGAEEPDGAVDDTAAADGSEGVEGEIPEEPAESETVFVNKDGVEVLPSTLVGVDYNTVAGSYDGETNVLKQYVVSDTYGKDMIMDSYVDENGNLVMIISQGVPETEAPEEEPSIIDQVVSALAPGFGLDAEQGGSGSAPAIDGSGSGWDEVPVSYEYNWDNSANCWQWGNWITDPVTGEQICYKTEEGTYDSNVRHEMQMYSDGENVYLKITYATIYQQTHSNGDDFNFYIDGVGTKFGITQANGQTITGWNPEAGTYVVDVRNGDASISSTIVDGAVAYYHVTENGVNNQLELKIPMEAFKTQNGEVNLDNYSMIQFFTPNLMYNRITAAGSPTGAVPFATVVFLFVPASYVLLKRKDKEMAFA